MEPFERDELTESELDRLLDAWTIPDAPVGLRTAIFSGAKLPGWKRWWTGSVRVPIPIACVLLLAISVAVLRVANPPPPRIVVKIERVQVPVVQERVVTKVVTRYTDRKEPTGFDIHGLKPVAELRPRIIRSGDAKN